MTQQHSRLTFIHIGLCALLAVLANPVFGQSSESEHKDDAAPIVVMNQDSALSAVLLDAYQALGADYEPRTEHILENGIPSYINRLVLEDSPYLLQHAHNPVNWFAWGDEAFAAAIDQDKPIFLSIGYATCHWCHVMERESFENEAIAAFMNDHFISIKVDREQLPDIDALYMKAAQMITGRGGWPMSSFLDSEGRTFFGGTYFAPDQFTQLIERVSTLWVDEREELSSQAIQIAEALSEANELVQSAERVKAEHIDGAVQVALNRFDDIKGGFGPAPKFPQEPLLHFLLNQAARKSDTQALEAANFSLMQMAAGGIHDQVGGGFHRYAVDNEWIVPHFEKMLYNQGSLARNYTQAYNLTSDAEHERTARRLLDYVIREMTNEEGLFYSATDADSDGGEGRFFTWTPEELESVLGEDDGNTAATIWGVNYIGHLESRSILHQWASSEELAEELDMSIPELRAKRDELAQKLYDHRVSRIPPLRDEKIITAWNGLMITAFAEAATLLDEERYEEVAVSALNQLWNSATKDTGGLWRTQFRNQTSIDGRQQDYAYLIEAMLSVYDLTNEKQWLERSEVLTEYMIEHFWDKDVGGFFMSYAESEASRLVVRPKDLFDGSMPSGNAVAMHVLSKLVKRSDNLKFDEYATKLIAYYAGTITQQPGGQFYLLSGISDHLQGETGPVQYGARGKVRARATLHADNEVHVQIDVKDGWHINSDKPYQDYLIPTSLSNAQGDPLTNVAYPQPIERQLGFERSVLSLFENSITLRTNVAGNESSMKIQARLQACSDEVCLPPETITLPVLSQ